MYLSNLRLYNFRNIKQASIEFSSGLNFIVGRNGQGKTNLVEAIHFLSLARSFRTSKTSELIHWGESEGSVFGTVCRTHSDFEIGVALSRGRKEPYLNGDKARSLTEFVGKLLCVGFSPDDLQLVKGAPQGRRKLLDRHMAELDPIYMSVLVNYQKALRNKTNLLRTGDATDEQLRVWNDILAEPMSEIYRKRLTFVAKLQEVAAEFYTQYGPGDGELTFELHSSVPGDGSVEEVREKLEKIMGRERAARAAVLGSHRDDLLMFLGGKDSRSFASQGQARSIVLAIKLAVISLLEQKYGESPVIVLDDVESELDQLRSSAFFDLVFHQGRQVFITGTDLRQDSFLAQENVSVHEVSEGELVESDASKFCS